jgi:hypothetical protein
MPLKAVKRGNKYRLVEPDGRIAKNQAGKAIDGGGKATKAAAQRQITAINISKRGK